MSSATKTASLKASKTSPSVSFSGSFFRLLPNEDASAYERLLADLDHEFEPVYPSELLLVEEMAQNMWLRGRAQPLHDSCWDMVNGGVKDGKRLLFYTGQMQRHQNAFTRTLNTFLKLRKGMRVLKRFSPVK